jgi:hypothetical protein
MKKIFQLVLVLFTTGAISQNYIGYTTGNYAGIHGATFNPANIVSSKFKTDVNLISVSAFAGSDYFNISVGDLTSIDDSFDFNEDIVTNPTDNNNFFINTDILGPSFMLNLSPKSSIGLITRIRGFSNTRNINGVLFENLINDFEENADFDFESQNLSQVLHGWGEIGLAYGRILVSKPKHMLSGGVTLKVLTGAGGTYIDTPGLEGTYTDATETLTTNGFLNLGSSIDIEEEDDFTFDDITLGFGLEIGFNYEYHPDRDDDTPYYQSDYMFKIGVSVTDIGSITYDNSTIYNYDLNATVSTSTFDEDIRDFLDNNYESLDESESIQINLPTAMHLMFDYRLSRKFLLNAQANISLVGDGDFRSNRIINTYTFTPRYESRLFSLFAPVSIRQYGDFAFGAGFRFGPFSIGSASVFSNLLSDESRTTDLFVGLKVPVFR